MRKTFIKIKRITLVLGIVFSTAICVASENKTMDGYGSILVKEAHVESSPKGSSIHASINGHTLVVAFTENLGQVAIEVTTASGAYVECLSTPTPNGVQIYIPQAGDYVITFTLPNGDEYYGEFTVTD